ncbi:hypothetical protein PspLS_11096 [Pyricularia sp. CBS 133598]|nr:hypothetical protein PspLS_11096 [Pyricularia sp. CBS 133598]
MTETASPVPPRQQSDAVDRERVKTNLNNDHIDELLPSPFVAKPVEDINPVPLPILEAVPSSPSDSSLSDPLSEPPSDEEEIELSILSGRPGTAPEATKSPPECTAEAEDNECSQAGGALHEEDGALEERPTKRRRVRDHTPPPPPSKTRDVKLESPPWKKFEAEGPTSFTDEGKRRSGRINLAPAQLQRAEQQTPKRGVNGTQTSTPAKNKYASTNGNASSKQKPQASATSNRRPSAPAKSTPPAKPPVSKTTSRTSGAHETRTSQRSRRRSPSPPPKLPSRASARSRRSTGKGTLDPATDDTARAAPRIKLRVTKQTTIPFVHPAQAKTRPKLGPSFEEYFDHARNIPVEEGGQYATDDTPPMTDEMALEEARVLDRIEQETDPGGLLSVGKCSVYAPEVADEPPRQWAHMDHLVKAVSNFRRLMLQEQQRHRSTARKLAEACRDEWLRRQPKTAEQLEREQYDMWRAKYGFVVRAMFGTWENVKAEINRKRIEEWQAEEQRRVKAALQEAVQISEQKLQARQLHPDEDGITDDDSGIDRTSDEEQDDSDVLGDDDMMSGSEMDQEVIEGIEADAADESNMSSSEDEEDAKSTASDEGLTQEQLREKYAHISGLDTPNNDGDTPLTPGLESKAEDTANADETSDESVDMDDDMGSSDMDSDDDDDAEESEGDDEEDDDDAPGGLLGLFFGKSELKQLTTEAEQGHGVSGDADVEMAEQTPPAEVESPPKVNGSAPSTTTAIADSKADAATGDVDTPEQNNNDTINLKHPPHPQPAQSRLPSDGPENTKTAPTAVDSVENTNTATLSPGSHPLTHSAVSTLQKEGAKDHLVPPDVSPLTAYQDDPEDFSPEASIAYDSVDPPVATVADQDVSMVELFVPESLSPATPSLTSHQPPTIEQTSADLMQQLPIPGPVAPEAAVVTDMDIDDVTAKQNDTTSLLVTADEHPTEAEATVTKVGSPETDLPTNLPSRESSRTPHTADTKPSEIDTATSVEASGNQEISRSASPLPGAAKTEIPFLLRGTLREYQHFGLDWLAGLYANNTNGILADEMGLGKTIQTISLLAHLACHHEVWGPHLVVVPTSVMLNWEMEFKKWCPGFKILTYYGNQEERKRKRQGWSNDDVWNVCITSYQMVLQDQQVFRRRRWHYMILDEAHNIKNFKSQRWQTLLGFNTQARLLITGTPLQNNLTELWSLLFFLMPSENGVGGFADLKEFHDWFSKPESQILESGREQMDDEARAIISKLHKVLRPYLLRRLKADVEKQMPAKYEHVELCRLSKRQRELYDGFLSRSDTRETLSGGNYLSIINCLMQLRKVCNHPDLFVDRPIMTSFRMQSSVPSHFSSTEKLIRGKLFAQRPFDSVNLEFMNLVPAAHERFSDTFASSVAQYNAHRALNELREAQKVRAHNAFLPLDPSTVESNIIYLESASRWGRFEELQHCIYLNALRRQQQPIYGTRLVELLTIGVQERPFKPKPKIPKKIIEWFESDSHLLHNAVQTLDRRAESMEMLITKFACVTPAVVTRDLTPFMLGEKGVNAFEEADLRLSAPVKRLPFIPRERPHDPWHEARMRLSIQFPDKRLLQYDCGKLQALDRLLRKLQAGGHRALIFTQMTKVLDILEQFLNIHGHKYLRLDGATKVEQRQILTDRFNHDPRILCFILSTRSGGLGINLTGADTVIFYDQDWNPAMDKQCQDRCHRIGQTRDVHIYRLVSEHTIEANILRKASQKQMLDDVVIQEGEFTTDYFNKISVRDVLPESESGAGANSLLGEGDAAANAAMDRVLGGVESTDTRTAGRALEQAEDKEDVTAAHAAEKEIQQDDADFSEKPQNATTSSTRQGTPADALFGDMTADQAAAEGQIEPTEPVEVEHNAWGDKINTVDSYMLTWMAKQLEGTPLDLPKDKKKSKKKGKDTRKR